MAKTIRVSCPNNCGFSFDVTVWNAEQEARLYEVILRHETKCRKEPGTEKPQAQIQIRV